jgi:glycosyltransferase involved in cell wall biosynthesis
MEKEPLVSVGIPCYNRPESMKRTLERITGQTYRNLEIIVSDNCSSDPRVESVGREFASKDLRVQYYRQDENKGAMSNFQFVLEKATGEYFMWAADDDLLDLDYVESLMSIHFTSEYILVGANYDLEGPSGIFKNVIMELPKKLWKNLGPNYQSLKLFLKTPHWRTQKQALFYGIYKKEKLLNYILSKETVFFHNLIDIGSDLLIIYAMICSGPVCGLNKKIWIHHVDYEIKGVSFYEELRRLMTILPEIPTKTTKYDKEIDMYIEEIKSLSEICINGSLEKIMIYIYIARYKLTLKYWYF